ncbi:Nitroreductase [Paramicrobacterium humi]|uniref:Putative NAD(P)H nitroreductase n=1 Tax=Paramicrobacterium humi TaxID=640635 RepID=A0A1H4NRZ8_9MICO|nr:nitroreductase family protein [Microbacterium humi]SEB98003.1 Nitroreductase [Microbacterium humi]
MSSLVDRVAARRSWSKVTGDAPDHAELARLVAAAGRVADHSGLEPWRLIELRGAARERLGAALAEAAEHEKPSSKPLRAPLLIAIVACRRESHKVPDWEQDAVTAGVAHMLSLLLADAGWGVMWRTGSLVRAEPVRRMHELADNEELLGWLYVGGIPENTKDKPGHDRSIDPERFLTVVDR